MKIYFKNPYDLKQIKSKTINENSKRFRRMGDDVTFTFTACGGATFYYEHRDGVDSLATSEYPEDCYDWSPVEIVKVS